VLAEIRAPVIRNAREQDMVVAAFDDVDGIDLHVTEMGDRVGNGLRPCTERTARIKPLRTQPDMAGGGGG
jgi:hypothetical protein